VTRERAHLARSDETARPMRQPMHVVATAGHVDHGKSALVRALTGTDPDRFVEERRRGLTIDLGFAWTTLPGAGPVVFVDVPGHVRFISNMLAGVAVIEAGLLCVDAREGWRAQTEEHLQILDLIGLPAGLVAVTKAGLVDAQRIAVVRAEVARRTAGTVLADAPVVACDAIDGTGLDELRDRLAAVLTAHPVAQSEHDRPRLWVDRSFTIAGAGTVVTGGVGHGTFVIGDRVVAVGAKSGAAARVRGIEALGQRVDRAPARTRAALNLAGVERRAVRRGDAIVRPDEWHVTAAVEATLTVVEAVDHEVTHRGAYLAYLGTGEHAIRLLLQGSSDLIPGETGTVRLTLGHALPLVPGDRYVLRETGRGEIVGGGEVVDLDPRWGRARSRRAPGVTPGAPAGAGGSERPLVGEGEWVRAEDLERRLGVAVEPVVEGWVVAPATLQAARTALLERLDGARPVGLDVARLGEHDRAILVQLEREQLVRIVAGYAVAAGWEDELARHPLVQQLEEHLFTPPAPTPARVPPEVLRALVRRGHVLVKDGVYFAARARSAAATTLAQLSREQPEGFTVSQAREALGTTRKWAVPLLELLDESGITVRHGDRRRVRSAS
jgi:selenocysteine-specific elongation factor